MPLVQLSSPRSTPDRREAVVLLVVIALLALFAALALSFVFYAESAAVATGHYVQAQNSSAADAAPELLLRYFLSQLIYDTDNEYSALQGHSLARTMYGGNPAGGNNVPFNGTGRLRYNLTHPKTGTIKDNFHLINYQNYQTVDGFTRRPEFYGFTSDPNHRYVGEANVPWTYPDEHNMFLALVSSAGEVMLPSYQRPWLYNPKDPMNVGWEKYLTLSPHPSYHTQFVTPDADPGGHVKNLDWGRGVPYFDPTGLKKYANNDSYWIDAGWPVMTAADGRKYKALFAPLVMELDSRVNLQTTGALRNGAAMTGNQGWGRWEINPVHVLADPKEFNNLFLGNGGVPGRYGPNAVPEGARQGLMGTPPWFARFDFDGDGAALQLPAAGSLLGFPTFPAKWESGNANELGSPIPPSTYNHPWNYNYFTPAAGDFRTPLSNFEAQLRLGGKGSAAFTSDLFKLLPNNMSNARTRNLTTLLSFDVNRPGLVPFYAHDPLVNSPYEYIAAATYPRLKTPVLYPTLPPTSLPNSSEFTAAWRSRLGSLGRVNLHQFLTDYPATDPVTGLIDYTIAKNKADFDNAVKDRQALARQIYQTLIAVTGAMDPNQIAGGMPKTDPRFQAARWLAQLAVNMVDFIDNDDYMTPFQWYMVVDAKTLLPLATETIFGVELPRLVINEAYAQYDNDPLDPMIPTANQASYYKLNCWVELHNPFQDTPAGELYPRDGGQARLKIGASNVYRLFATKSDKKLRQLDNLLGDPNPARVLTVVDDWGTQPVEQTVLPGNGAYAGTTGGNQGFYVVGPRAATVGDPLFLAGRDPNLPLTYATPKMSAAFPLTDKFAPDPMTYVLQRLANPHMPFDANPIDPFDPAQKSPNPLYNPYVTVDYIEKVKAIYEGRLFAPKPAKPMPPTSWSSWGRNQPYAAHFNHAGFQKPNTQGPSQPKHTFYRHNAIEDSQAPYPDMTTKPAAGPGQTLKTPFDWLFHLDRRPINAMELLHVSGYRPHELTQQFVVLDPAGIPVAQKHYAPWFDQDALIYRFLEMAYPPDLLLGADSRMPGKINLNMVFDYEVFLALCDPQAGNGFNAATVKSVYNRLIASRTPTVWPDGTRVVAGGDRPFWSFAAGVHPALPNTQYPAGLGMDNTLFRTDAGGRMLVLPGNHPYQQYELITKLANNVTTRSNCFAVWLTVGFFEVVDESARPPKLGAELGRGEGRHIRHRMFALIDRTELRARIADPTGSELSLAVASPITIPLGQKKVTSAVAVPSLTFPMLNGGTWTNQPGTQLTLNPGTPNEETVVVESTNPGVPPNTPPSFVATFSRDHAAGEPIISRLNMGPWPLYHPRNDPQVVPYFSVID